MRVTATMSVLRDGQEIELEVTGEYTPGEPEEPGALYERVPERMDDIEARVSIPGSKMWRNIRCESELTSAEEAEAEHLLVKAVRAQQEAR